jgi:hypothetical protein
LITDAAPLWETDGLRVLEQRWTPEFVQILFSVTPDVAPLLVTARAKGRLDHALRKSGLAMSFSRKVSLRSVGDNTRRDVEAYIERQVPRRQFVDPQTEARLAEFTIADETVDFSHSGSESTQQLPEISSSDFRSASTPILHSTIAAADIRAAASR